VGHRVTDRKLALRQEIVQAFAATGEPPRVSDAETLSRLAEAHVVALDENGGIEMAHPFAAHRWGTRVEAGGRRWWGSCAWDGLGIVAALGLRDAEVTSGDVAVAVRDGAVVDDGSLFHVLVPARHWWDDIAHT
jgi:alkylmercury lyase-like protein